MGRVLKILKDYSPFIFFFSALMIILIFRDFFNKNFWLLPIVLADIYLAFIVMILWLTKNEEA